VAKPRKRKPGGGSHGSDDAEAKKQVRAIMAAHPKWKHYAAALKYAQTLPASTTKPESIARRIADKLKREDGVFQRRAATKKMLRELEVFLFAAWSMLHKINEEDGSEGEPEESP
jgi:hypothetical protein